MELMKSIERSEGNVKAFFRTRRLIGGRTFCFRENITIARNSNSNY